MVPESTLLRMATQDLCGKILHCRRMIEVTQNQERTILSDGSHISHKPGSDLIVDPHRSFLLDLHRDTKTDLLDHV